MNGAATGPARWDWAEAARRAGTSADGTFNAGAMPLPATSAVIWRRADGDTVTLSGGELMQRARNTAAVLAELGVKRGDRVAGLLGRGPDSFAAALATWQLGAIYVPLFSGLRGEGLQVRMGDCDPAVAVTDTANRTSLDAVATVLPMLKIMVVDGDGDPAAGDIALSAALGRYPVAPAVVATGLHETSTIMYTSGTTGRPKGCQIPHRGVLCLLPYVRYFLAIVPGDVLFSGADAGWSFGLFTTGLAPMLAGAARVVYEGPFEPVGWWRAVADLPAPHLAAAPTAFRQLAAAGAGQIPGQFAAGSSAGEPLDAVTVEWFERNAGVTIRDSYGLSELGMVTGNLRMADAPPALAGSMGTELPGFEVGLIGVDGEFIHGEGSGRIVVKDNGFLLSAGYWGRQDEWKARFADGWFLTEDIASRDELGRYWYQSRADDMVVSSGYNIGPAEVETALLSHPLVTDAACVAEPDAVRGAVVAAHVVLAAPAPADLLAQLRSRVAAGVGWYAAPRRVHVHDSLPRTESGKIQRNLLRAAGNRM